MAKERSTRKHKPALMPPDARSACIVAEICKCDHTKSAHHDHRYEPGHGPCTICHCPKFTWKRFAYENPH